VRRNRQKTQHSPRVFLPNYVQKLYWQMSGVHNVPKKVINKHYPNIPARFPRPYSQKGKRRLRPLPTQSAAQLFSRTWNRGPRLWYFYTLLPFLWACSIDMTACLPRFPHLELWLQSFSTLDIFLRHLNATAVGVENAMAEPAYQVISFRPDQEAQSKNYKKRKTHRKSKAGCFGCKVKRVKVRNRNQRACITFHTL
jgi:hypothetical protein